MLVLVAIGLAITFGVMGVINMAHGELMMLGAYTTYVVQLLMPHAHRRVDPGRDSRGVPRAGAGRRPDRADDHPLLYGRPLETLLATFGVSLILQQLVRSVFSANNRAVATPPWMSGTVQINDALAHHLEPPLHRAFTSGCSSLLLVLKKTRLGLQIRAVSQNRGMARAMGIRSSGWTP